MNVHASPFDLSGKTALVTGANTGIGQAIAVALANAGAAVVGVGRSAMDDTALLIEGKGGRFAAVNADLSDMNAVRGLMPRVTEECGRPDILVNNAGIIRRADAVDFTEEDWDAVMDVNLKSVFFLCQAFAAGALARWLWGSGARAQCASVGGVLFGSASLCARGRACVCVWCGVV